VAAGRRRTLAKELGDRATFERRTFLLLPGSGQRPVYDEYVISHRIAARRNAPELAFAVPQVGHPYPRSSLPAALLAQLVQKAEPAKLEALEEELYRSVFVRLEDVADPAVLKRCAPSVGLDEALVARALDDEELVAQAKAEHIEAAEHGISGIPALLVPGQEPIVGAVPLDVYRAAVGLIPPTARRGRRIG